MRFLLSRPLAFPVVCAAVAASFTLLLAGCGDKSNDSAATQGAYGESASSAPAAPSSTASVAPVTAASPTAIMPTPDGNGAGTTAGTTAVTAPPLPNAPFAGGAAGGGGPMMGGGDPNAPLSATPDLDRKIDGLKSGDKKALAAAYADRGYARMTDDKAGARVKYRKALEDYRVALQNDPANAKAKENKDTIEQIYRSMGRPIPGEESGTGSAK